ncbi:hypothetical protein [Blastococcus sp. SYSU DS0617]
MRLKPERCRADRPRRFVITGSRDVMRSLSRAALVVLTAVVVLGVTPAAKAADFSLSWSQSGGELPAGQNPAVCPSGYGFESGQTVLVQALQGGAWVDKRTYAARPVWGWCFEFDATALVPGPGTHTFRALSRVPSTGQLATTEAATFTLRKDDGRVFFRNAGDFLATYDWMGAGLRLTTTSPQNLVTSLEIDRAHGQVVDLQRKAGSNWVNVGRARAPETGTDVTVRIRIPVRAGHATHRFVSRATAWSPTVITPPFSVYQTAKRNRAAYVAEARHYMAKYCPKTQILIDTPAVTSGSVAGRASYGMAFARGKKVLLTRIELRSGMAPDELRFVALHECAHIVQYRSVVQGRFGTVQKQAARLWPGLGIEGQADCMAYQVTRDFHWFGYVRGCSKAQLVNAAKMWKTYGGKYQGATHRF